MTERAARDVGLDFFDVVFEMLDASDVNAVAAYGGFPERYPSWRFGMEYERLQKGYDYGLSKIYELVINNDPTYAYLVRSNSVMEQKLVMAHVMGHADFFKHNVWFSPTSRTMVDGMAHNAACIRAIVEEHGRDTVERFLDLALSVDGLIDPYLPLREARAERKGPRPEVRPAEQARLQFERNWGNDSPRLVRQPDALGASESCRLPTFDIIGFLVQHAPLLDWQERILTIVREEAYYFAPQGMTKIMNEGWASFWHSHLLTHGLLGPSEIVDFADCHAGATAVAPGQLNPYKLGIELFRHAQQRGDDIFELRRIHNDVSFIDHVVDEEFARTNQLFVYERNSRTGEATVVDHDWRAIKGNLLDGLAWGGSPRIKLVDAGSASDGALVLVHEHEGRDLKIDEAGAQLKNIATLWGAPVHLLTQQEGEGRRICVQDGKVSLVETSLPPGEVTESGSDARVA